MKEPHRDRLFDTWAENYDDDIASSGGAFPFDGYRDVLDEVLTLADVEPGMRVLDLGIGTGNLAARFVRQGCDVWGVDFSSEMIARARAKLPQIHLIQADLLGGWPTELQLPFERIVSAYVLHEFDLDTKLSILLRLSRGHLTRGGSIVVGDIAFPTVQARERAHQEWAELWDEDEHYWAADETRSACKQAGLQVAYRQVSSCGGVFVFTPRNGI